MALETGTYISDLVITNPVSTDGIGQADDHLRLIKKTLLNTFPSVEGAVTATNSELSVLKGILSTTDELNILSETTVTTADLDKLSGVTASSAELNILTGATVTTAELNILDGVKADKDELNILDGATVSTTEINKLKGYTGTALDLNLLAGAAAEGMTAEKILYLNGLDGSLSEALGSKLNLSGGTMTGNVTFEDNKILKFGTHSDAELFHNNSHLYLDVNKGDLKIRDGAANNTQRFNFDISTGNLEVGGAITASGDITAFSDARLKSDVMTVDNALDRVSEMRGVFYVKDGSSGVGVIAQEMEQVLPEVVHENHTGYKSVAYGNIVGVLIEAIKELKAEIETLKSTTSQKD